MPKKIRARTLTKLPKLTESNTENFLKTKRAEPAILSEDPQRVKTRSDNELPIWRTRLPNLQIRNAASHAPLAEHIFRHRSPNQLWPRSL